MPKHLLAFFALLSLSFLNNAYGIVSNSSTIEKRTLTQFSDSAQQLAEQYHFDDKKLCQTFPYSMQSYEGTKDAYINFNYQKGSLPQRYFLESEFNNTQSWAKIGFDKINKFPLSLDKKRMLCPGIDGIDGEFCVAGGMKGIMPITREFPRVTTERIYRDQKITLTPEDRFAELRLKDTDLTLTTGIYYIQRLVMSGNSQIHIQGSVVLHVRSIELNDGNISINADHQDAKQLFIVAHTPSLSTLSIHVKPAVRKASLYGMIIAKGDLIFMPETGILSGRVTARSVEIGNQAIFVDQTQIEKLCQQTTDYSLDISPKQSQALLCERVPIDLNLLLAQSTFRYSGTIPVDISVLSKNQQGQWVESPQDDVCFATTQSEACHKKPNSSGFRVNLQEGKAQFWLGSKSPNEFKIKATLQMGAKKLIATNDSRGEGYQFKQTGLFFKPSIEMVAGQPVQITTTAMTSSKDGRCMPLTDYTGSKKLEFKIKNYITPDSGNLNVTPEHDLVSFKKINGHQQGSFKLNYLDSGLIAVEVTDPSYQYCEDLPNGSTINSAQKHSKQNSLKSCRHVKNLSGTLFIRSKPYLLALCEQDGSPLTADHLGDSQTGSLLKLNDQVIRSGDPFDLIMKPIIWQNGDPAVGDASHLISIDSSDHYCTRPITANFLKSDAITEKELTERPELLIKPQLLTPIDGQLGSFNGLWRKTLKEAKTEIIPDQGFLFKDLAWNEAGSLLLNSELVGTYLGMKINVSTLKLGRFSPHHLEMDDSLLQDAQSSFTYMQQPFILEYRLKAVSRDGKVASNYGLFSKALQVKIQPVAVDEMRQEGINDLTQRFYFGNDPFRRESKNINNTSYRVTYIDPNIKIWDKGYHQLKAIRPLFYRLNYNRTRGDFEQRTLADGPYPKIALGVISDKNDGLDFDLNTRSFTPSLNMSKTNMQKIEWRTADKTQWVKRLDGHLNMRYGRLKLASRSGGFNNLPLIVTAEYFDGDRFTINLDDNETVIYPLDQDGKAADSFNVQCRDKRWRDDFYGSAIQSHIVAPNSALPLIKGSTILTVAPPSSGSPEVADFWLLLGSHKDFLCDSSENNRIRLPISLEHPWLKFNWPEIAVDYDTDPVATMKFGTSKDSPTSREIRRIKSY